MISTNKPKPSRGNDDDTQEPNAEKAAVPFHCDQSISRSFKFFLTDAIGEPDKYNHMCHVLRTATENDQVFIHLNSPGGRLDSTAQIIAAMRESEATVTTVADGTVASAATLIFLAADAFVVQPYCMFMIHTFSTATYGKGHEVNAHIEADSKWFYSMAQQLYDHFLTKREIARMVKGEDFWFIADEVNDRIQRRVEYLREQNEELDRESRVEHLNQISEGLKSWMTKEDSELFESLVSKVAARIKAGEKLSDIQEIQSDS